MKKTKSLLLLVVAVGIIFNACEKEKSYKHTSQSKSTCSDNHGFGTIERCSTDSNLWFINTTYGNTSMPYFNPDSFPNLIKILLPQNLPDSFKKNLTRVSFDFKYLNDSVSFSCGCGGSGTILPVYAQKITLCDIKEDTTAWIIAMKPVIYLYPEKASSVKVELKYAGKLTVTYPDYDPKISGWNVIAQTDGTLKNKLDGMEYQYLFWEGTPSTPYDFNMNEGFCVKGSETKKFLQTILPQYGLTPKEYNEMIVFWLPKMMNNKYNLIHFAGKKYTDGAPLVITPKPDNLIRVFMAFQPSAEYIKTTPQKTPHYSRKGFTVVEWGGVEMPTIKHTILSI